MTQTRFRFPCRNPSFTPRLARFGAAALALALAACGTTSGIAPKPAPDLLRVGVTPKFPPIVYKGANGEISGLEAALARKLGHTLGKRVRFVEVKWEGLIDALEADKIDIIMSGMSVTNARKARVAFAAPYLALGQILVVRSQDLNKFIYPDIIRITSQRIGVKPGTTGDLYVQRACPQAIRVPFKNPASAARALVRGEIDVIVQDMPVAQRLASDFEAQGLVAINKPMTLEYLAWGLRPGNTALLQSANSAVQRWSASGELKALVRQWVPR